MCACIHYCSISVMLIQMYLLLLLFYSESDDEEPGQERKFIFKTKKEAIEAFKTLLRDKVRILQLLIGEQMLSDTGLVCLPKLKKI